MKFSKNCITCSYDANLKRFWPKCPQFNNSNILHPASTANGLNNMLRVLYEKKNNQNSRDTSTFYFSDSVLWKNVVFHYQEASYYQLCSGRTRTSVVSQTSNAAVNAQLLGRLLVLRRLSVTYRRLKMVYSSGNIRSSKLRLDCGSLPHSG